MPVVLILDDRVTNRSVYARLAESVEDGVRVEVFADPHEALAWLGEHQADLIITDYKMPRMDGAEFTREVRQKPNGVDVPIVVITVYNDRSFRLRALESGATDFLLSPVDHFEFRTRARNLLALRQQQQLLKSHARTLEQELAVSERTREQLLRNSREALAQVIDTVPALISAADRDGRCVFVNAMQAAAVNASPAELVGRDVADLLGPLRVERSREADRIVFETGIAFPAYEEELLDGKGVRRVLLTTKAPLRDESGRVASVLTTSLDITDRKHAEDRLLHLAQHDPLTGLPNRSYLSENLTRLLGRGGLRDGRLALHFLDLDRFKAVNDVFGHQVGDRLLKAVARRLVETVRSGDVVTRLGGDEFAVLQAGVADPEDATRLAARITEALAQPFVLNGRELTISASIGITLHPRDGRSANELLRNADLAMYQAKAEGRRSYRFFDATLDARARTAMLLEADLRGAIARGEFELHYQPQVCLRSGKVAGAEALLRWRRPGIGLLAPRDFLPVAGETGLIEPIGAWVLHAACAQAAEWHRLGLSNLRVSANLSPVQFLRQDMRELIQRTLAETGLDPRMLELELTERSLMQNTDEVAGTLRDLRAQGVSFAIDDFGTGYSVLAYVKHFPVDRLKIDQSFVRNLKSDPADAAIVRAVIDLGHSLGLQVTAEGVETADQVAELMATGCDEIQGHYFSEPLPGAEFADFLRRGRTLPRVV